MQTGQDFRPLSRPLTAKPLPPGESQPKPQLVSKTSIPTEVSPALNNHTFGLSLHGTGLELGAANPSVLPLSISNDATGIEYLVDQVKTLSDAQIVIAYKIGGNLPITAAATLATLGVPLAIVATEAVDAYALELSELAYRYRSHAQLIAAYAQATDLRAKLLSPSLLKTAQDVLQRKKQLQDMITSEHRRMPAEQTIIAVDIRRHIEWLNSRIINIDAIFVKIFRNSSAWQVES